MSGARIAIVIPFVALNDYVVECLRHCLASGFPGSRIILLPDFPVELPEHLASDRVVQLPTGPVTIGRKRNIAWRRFPDFDYYALIDSDAFPAPHWLPNAVESFSNRSDVWAVGGPNITPPDEPLHQRVVGNAQQSMLVSGPMAFAKRDSSESRYCRTLHTCNLVLARIAFEALGGFDETLETGEDRELCRRIIANGGKIYFDRRVVVYHHNRRLWTHFFYQRLTYGHHSPALVRRGIPNDRLMYLPLLAILLFLAAFVSSWFGLPSLWTIGTLAIGYFLLSATEAVRHSNGMREAFLTLGAILTAKTGFVIGQVMALMGVQLDLKRVYENHLPHPRGNPVRG